MGDVGSSIQLKWLHACLLHLYECGEKEEEEVLDIQAMGGVLPGLVEVRENDIERVSVWDEVDHCCGNGHHQTQEKCQPPSGWMGVEWE